MRLVGGDSLYILYIEDATPVTAWKYVTLMKLRNSWVVCLGDHYQLNRNVPSVLKSQDQLWCQNSLNTALREAGGSAAWARSPLCKD